jgi:prepilin-type N-terminal cleavage/methylation domain-containing protein
MTHWKKLKLQYSRPHEEGFTLPEVLVTIVIFAVLSAISIPLYLNSRDAVSQKAIEADALRAVVPMGNYAAYLNADPAQTFTVGDNCATQITPPAGLTDEFVVLEADCLTINHIHNGFIVTATNARYSGAVTYSSETKEVTSTGDYR